MTERKFNILTVDDELPIAWSIRFALGGPARALASAHNGEEALARIQEQKPPFDLVITDNNMPLIDGLELVRRLRGQSFAGKIIVVSAHLSDEMQRAYRELNVDGMLSKPFNVNELRTAVDQLLAAA